MRVRTWPLRIVALLCALTFLFSAFMTSTYAWQSEQEAINNVYGYKTVMVPVELIKLEKPVDGAEVELPLPGTVFYLFRDNGSQVGGRYVTDENGRIQLELNAGRYYFEEVSPTVGYTYDTDDNGDPVTRYYFTVTDEDEKKTVTAYNQRLDGDLLIRKTVENADGAPLSELQKKLTFEFTVTFSDGGTYPYRDGTGKMQMLQSGGTLKLQSGQTAVFEELPLGLVYEVVETPVEGYTVTSSGHRGNITDTQAVADFVNRCEESEPGALIVTKEVQGENADLSKEFTFTAVIGDVTESFTLKHGESKEFIGIPIGTHFTVTEEDASAEGYTAMVDTFTGSIVAGETVILPFINIYHEIPPLDEEGTLTVIKEVIGEDADPDKEFTFEVVFTGAGAPENITFTLKAGEACSIENIPHGVSFTVFEIDANGYWPVLEQASGTIIGGTTTEVVITNRVPTEETGSITVEKEVLGENADPNATFAFTVEIGGSKQTFFLRDGESKTFTGLPIGTQYTVTEADASANGYIATVKEYTGQIIGTENILLPFVNIFEPDPDQPGSLTVIKKVTGENADPDQEFTFEVEFEGENAPAKETFTLKADGSKTFENIPHGVTYRVTETDAAGYLPVLTTASGMIIGGHESVVTFINRAPEPAEETVKLTVKKLLAGEYAPSDLEREFDMTLLLDGKGTDFTLKPNESKEFEVPAGTSYEVREEDYFAEGFTQAISNGVGVATGERIEVIVTNTYVGTPMVEIGGSKTWDLNGHTGVELPEFITVQLKNGELLVEEKKVTPDENGLWQYSFTAPKYNSDGSEATYTLNELPITSFRPTYNGYNIKNTYVAPIEVDPPIITKVVEGKNAPTGSFEFIFTGRHGTPMPEGSEGYRKTVTLNGAGEVEIGRITFTEPGVYVYSVHEKNGGAKGWQYDTALYTITITVTEEDGVLKAERTIVKNTSAADALQFTNVYEGDGEDTVLISGIKTWDHGSNPEKARPASIIVELYADGKLMVQRQVTASDHWQYSFEMPRFALDGHEIVYTIDEAEVEDYRKQIDGYDLINTYIGISSGITDEPDTPPESPETGDDTDLLFWVALMVLSLMGFISTALIGRRRYVYVGKHCKRRGWHFRRGGKHLKRRGKHLKHRR